MTRWLKQSTAVDVPLGPFVDSADGITPETGLTISQADCQLIKGAGAAAQKNDANSATHLAGGHYKIPLNSTDTNTLGMLRLYVNESGAIPMWADFMVVPANIYDSLIGGSDTLNADVTQWNGTNVATPDTAGYPKITVKSGTGTGEVNLSSGKVLLQDNAVTAAVVATDAIDSDAIAASAVTEIQSGLATSLSVSTLTGYVDTEVAGILAAVDTEVAEIKAKTDLIPASPAAVGDIPTSAAIADAVWDEAKSGHTAGGSFGEEVQSHATPAEVNTEVVDALTVDTYAELSGVPAATSSIKDKLNWLFMLARNKRTTTATLDSVRNDADSSSVATATLGDDGTTFTRGEYS